MVALKDQILVEGKSILILELSELTMIDIERNNYDNRAYEIDLPFLRKLHDLLKGKTKHLEVVLYIKRGIVFDQFINKYFVDNGLNESFTIVRSRDELYFMIGCLYTNLNRFLYASTYKNSFSPNIYHLLNPDPTNKVKMFKHINIKEFLKQTNRIGYLNLILKYMPECVDSSKKTYISRPIKMMEADRKVIDIKSEITKSTVDTMNEIKEHENNEHEDFLMKMHDDLKEKQKALDIVTEESKDEGVEALPQQSVDDLNKNNKLVLLPKNTKVFKPSTIQSKDRGFVVDDKGLLKITGFDDSLNRKFTNQLPELFNKVSKRFKVNQIMDTATYIKTLHNMYFQHYNKYLKSNKEFNDDTSSIIFPQILKFMHHKKFIEGQLLNLLVGKDILDVRNIEQSSRVTIDCEGLMNLFDEYAVNKKSKNGEADYKAVEIDVKDKAYIIVRITGMLLSNLAKPYTGFPKNKNSMLKKIGSIIRMYVNSNEISNEYKEIVDTRQANIKFGVYDLLQQKNIVQSDSSGGFNINKDSMVEYMQNVQNNIENCQLEIEQMEFMNYIKTSLQSIS